MGSFQFQIVPCSSLYFSRSIGPFQCLVDANYEVLICCTCHFQRVSLFVYFGFLCLQVSSVSNFLPDTRGVKVVTYVGSLVQSLCEEGGTLETNITVVCGECSQCLGHTGFAPLMACVLSQSTLLRLQVALQQNCPKQALGHIHFPGLSCSGSGSWVLHKGTDLVGPAFCAVPTSKQLRQPGAW